MKRHPVPQALTALDIALADTRALQASFKRLETTLESLREKAVQGRPSSLPLCNVPATQHRREHRAGIPAIIDSNPTLQAFILARLDRLTFKQIADEIAQHFPPALHIHQSTVHRWSQKRH